MVFSSVCAHAAAARSSRRVGPKAVSAWRPDAGHGSVVHADRASATADRDAGGATLQRTWRLRRPQEFAAVLAASRASSLRTGLGWLSVTAAWVAMPAGGARLGITVSKRMARRAIDRALVKRVVRESFRRSAPAMGDAAVAAGVRVDISVRLKRPVGLPGAAGRPALTRWRQALRSEADALFHAVTVRLGAESHHA